MAQWQELLKLDPLIQSRVCRLYEGKFPREIRHCLSHWIESQNWETAAADEATANATLEALSFKLDELKNESLHNNNVLMGPDFSAMKDFVMNNYETCPLTLAALLCDSLREEKAILISCLKDENCGVEEQKRQELYNKVTELNKQTWETEREIKSLEALNEKLVYIQRTWESEVAKMKGLSREMVEQECTKQANFIVQTQQVVVDQIVRSVNLGAQIVQTLVSVELPEWKRKQQMFCIGKPVCTSLEHLEKWFSRVVETLLQIVQQLKKLEEQRRPQTSPVSDLSDVLYKITAFTKSLITKLMQNALVVEKQPVMSKTHRPCILKTHNRFSVSLRFLVNLSMFKSLLKVKPEFDKDSDEVGAIKGFRQFVLTANHSKWLDVYMPKGGLVAEFENLSVKERLKGTNENPVSVTEELHFIKFVTNVEMPGFECQIETISLPVVVVTSVGQIPSAWASVMWYNLLSSNQPTSLSVFLDPPPLPWELLSQALSWQFLAAGDRELNEDQLNELKLKTVVDPDDLVYWNKFAKNNGPWIWIDGILSLIEKHLREIWRDGCIMGFVSKAKTRQLLQNKKSGNFLLRFSESSREGAITFSWVEHSSGEVNVHAVEPFTKRDLSAMHLPDIIYHYSLRIQERKTSSPLVYLFPDIPKDSVFGPYYTTQETPAAVSKDGYVNRTLISVTDCPTPHPSPPREVHMETETDIETGILEGPWSVSNEELLQEYFPEVLDPSIPLAPLPFFEQLFPMLNNLDCENGLEM